jgi:hypothetical protein
MAGKRGGISNYSVAEAQNVSLGQAGVAFLSGTGTYTPPTGQVVVAIQAVDDITFDSADATTAESLWPTDAQGGPGTGSVAINQTTIPSGMTIYGRWDTVAFDSGKAFLYLG